MTAAIGGLGARGELVVVGAAAEPIEVSPVQLITGNRTIIGHASGTSKDSEDTLAFSELAGIRRGSRRCRSSAPPRPMTG